MKAKVELRCALTMGPGSIAYIPLGWHVWRQNGGSGGGLDGKDIVCVESHCIPASLAMASGLEHMRNYSNFMMHSTSKGRELNMELNFARAAITHVERLASPLKRAKSSAALDEGGNDLLGNSSMAASVPPAPLEPGQGSLFDDEAEEGDQAKTPDVTFADELADAREVSSGLGPSGQPANVALLHLSAAGAPAAAPAAAAEGDTVAELAAATPTAVGAAAAVPAAAAAAGAAAATGAASPAVVASEEEHEDEVDSPASAASTPCLANLPRSPREEGDIDDNGFGNDKGEDKLPEQGGGAAALVAADSAGERAEVGKAIVSPLLQSPPPPVAEPPAAAGSAGEVKAAAKAAKAVKAKPPKAAAKAADKQAKLEAKKKEATTKTAAKAILKAAGTVVKQAKASSAANKKAAMSAKPPPPKAAGLKAFFAAASSK